MARLFGLKHPEIAGWSMVIIVLVLMAAGSFAVRTLVMPRPIRLGFIATLSGRGEQLGQEELDAAMLAIDECNDAGGIGGRAVQLLARDERNDPESFGRVLADLDRQDVAAIIGPASSQAAFWALNDPAKRQIVMVSPTARSERLSHLDDELFRVCPSSLESMEQLARYLSNVRRIHSVCLLLDVTNPLYSRDAAGSFVNSFQARGGTVTQTIEFNSGDNIRHLDLARRVKATGADGVLILADAVDTAMFCQQMRKLDPTIPLCTSEWAATQDLIVCGGRSVEGLVLFNSFDRSYPADRYQAFCRRFTARFGYPPGFASVHAYDSARILLMALAEDATRMTMKQKLSEIGSFEGLQGRISFDSTGDIRRELFLVTVRNGEFHSME